MISILFSIFFSDTGAGSSPIGAPHRVLIASEEQLQTKILPSLTAHKKYKLTAHEGARIRKIGFVTFLSKADKDYSENCLTCLTNQGDLVIHSLPELRRQVLQVSFSKKKVKVEKILKGSLDSIPSPSPPMKIQIMGRRVCLRC